MATRPHILHDFPDGFSPDFLDLTILRLISFNALFHDVFHERADGETFLSKEELRAKRTLIAEREKRDFKYSKAQKQVSSKQYVFGQTNIRYKKQG